MSEPTEAPSSTSRATAVDLWRWQLDALTDLAAFVKEHGPRKPAPLPGLEWRVGTTRSLSAEIWPYSAKPLETLEAYADVLGVNIISHDLGNRVHHRVRGRIGVREGAKQEPRCQVVIGFIEWREQ